MKNEMKKKKKEKRIKNQRKIRGGGVGGEKEKSLGNRSLSSFIFLASKTV